MDQFSEENIKKNCPHCDRKSEALKNVIEETNNFFIVCDAYPIIEGHLLIIPKEHLSCVGEYSAELFVEFLTLYEKYLSLLKKIYGFVSSFEHGKFGQTVFHSHVHLLPFFGQLEEIIPEGNKYLKPVELEGLKLVFEKEGGYLYLKIANNQWLVDKSLARPRFLRDRFAKALGRPERGDWKAMNINSELMRQVNKKIKRFKEKLKNFSL